MIEIENYFHNHQPQWYFTYC